MNIQIFGTNKCFDTKKAMRYFKERNIKYQLSKPLMRKVKASSREMVRQFLRSLSLKHLFVMVT